MTPDPEAVEQIAKALCVADGHSPDDPSSPAGPFLEHYKKLTQAALTAFLQLLAERGLKVVAREPTEEMCRACPDEYFTGDKEELARIDWQAMWDAPPSVSQDTVKR